MPFIKQKITKLLLTQQQLKLEKNKDILEYLRILDFFDAG
jgi:hypothetical protein